MNIKRAATLTKGLVPGHHTKRSKDGRGIAHARWMLGEIETGDVEGEKAHRWLGYAQAIIVQHYEATLEDVKRINEGS